MQICVILLQTVTNYCIRIVLITMLNTFEFGIFNNNAFVTNHFTVHVHVVSVCIAGLSMFIIEVCCNHNVTYDNTLIMY